MALRLFRDIPRSVLRAETAARKKGARLFPLGWTDFQTARLRVHLRERMMFLGQFGPHDNRRETCCGSPEQQLCAEAVAAIVPGSLLVNCGDHWTLAQSRPCTDLCPDEPFSQQPRFRCDVIEPAAWTGSLVHESALLTCWHDNGLVERKQYYAVFGFTAQASAFFQPRFELEDVVPIAGLLMDDRQPCGEEEDWAILRLKTPVKHRPVIEVREMPPSWWAGAKPSVYTLGHPVDLPMKLVDDAWAAEHPKTPTRFVAPLDTYKGCSGSPVFAVAEDGRHVLMGIIVAGQPGEPHFDRCETRNCWRRHIYEYTYSDLIGQACVRARAFETCVKSLYAAGAGAGGMATTRSRSP